MEDLELPAPDEARWNIGGAGVATGGDCEYAVDVLIEQDGDGFVIVDADAAGRIKLNGESAKRVGLAILAASKGLGW